MKTKDELEGEIRYAIRLTQRTARFYRHIQTSGIFLAILGGSGTISLLAKTVPEWIGMSGALLLAVAGAALIAIRPADKAAQNEADVRRYQALMAKSKTMTDAQLETALEETHQGDAPEIESLRDIAYNDVVAEFGCTDKLIQLSKGQRILAVLA